MLQILILILLGIGFPTALFSLDVSSLKWLRLGAEAWVVAILIKSFLGVAISAFSHRFLKTDREVASIWGIWSSLCDLGVTIYYFKTQISPRLQDVVGFGIGASSLETLLLCIIYLYSNLRKTSENAPAASKDPFVVWGMVLERISYLGGYISARGIAWLGLQFWYLLPILLIVLFSFSLIDGVAAYGQVKGWDWKDPLVCRKYYAFHFMVVSTQFLIFIVCTTSLFVFGKL